MTKHGISHVRSVGFTVLSRSYRGWIRNPQQHNSAYIQYIQHRECVTANICFFLDNILSWFYISCTISYIFQLLSCFSSFCFYVSSLPFELLVQVLGHRMIGSENLWVIRAGVTKLFLFVGILQVTCQTFQLCRYVKVTVLLTHHLKKRRDFTKYINDENKAFTLNVLGC